jgi:hypothetical protein
VHAAAAGGNYARFFALLGLGDGRDDDGGDGGERLWLPLPAAVLVRPLCGVVRVEALRRMVKGYGGPTKSKFAIRKLIS